MSKEKLRKTGLCVVMMLTAICTLVLVWRKLYPTDEQYYRSLVSERPNKWQYHFDLGLTLEDQQRYIEAEEEYRRSMSCFPAQKRARIYPLYLHIADVLWKQGKKAQAKGVLDEILSAAQSEQNVKWINKIKKKQGDYE